MSGTPSAILTYHSLDDTGSVISIRPRVFQSQMKFLVGIGASVVPLDQIHEVPGAIAITFDDGFDNFYEHAFPWLAQHRLPATVFVISGYAGKRNDWPSQPHGIPCLDLMNWNRLKEISGYGITLGAHTRTHPIMTRIPEHARESELRICREEIEDRTGVAVSAFCYPYGNYDNAVRRQTASHFKLACSTALSYVSSSSDRFALPRLDVYYLQRKFWFERIGMATGRGYIAARRYLGSFRRRLE